LIFIIKLIGWLLLALILLVAGLLISRTYVTARFSSDASGQRFGLLLGMFWNCLQLGLEKLPAEPDFRFSLALFEHRFLRIKIRRKQKDSAEKEPKPKKERSTELSAREWMQPGREVLKRWFGIIHLDRLAADLTLGFRNPAVTGIFMGVYYGLKTMFSALRDVDIQPYFVQARLRGSAELRGSIQLLQSIPCLIFSYRQYRQVKRKQTGAES